MKSILTIAAYITGIVLSLYIGAYVMLFKGISDCDCDLIAVAKIVLALPVGFIIFYVFMKIGERFGDK